MCSALNGLKAIHIARVHVLQNRLIFVPSSLFFLVATPLIVNQIYEVNMIVYQISFWSSRSPKKVHNLTRGG